MNVLHDFIRASASYFGIPPEQLVEGSELDTSRGAFEVVLRVSLTHDDVMAVAARCVALREDLKAQVAADRAAMEAQPEHTRDDMREQYNALGKAERSVYGSFHRYVQVMGLPDSFVPASFVPGEKVEIPKVVWLDASEATEQQKAMAVGIDDKGRYGMDADDLTYEQRKVRGMQP